MVLIAFVWNDLRSYLSIIIYIHSRFDFFLLFRIFNGLQDEIDVLSDEIHGGGNGGIFGGNGGNGNNGDNGGIFGGFPGIPGLPGYPEPEYDVNNSTYEEKVNKIIFLLKKFANFIWYLWVSSKIC